MIRLCKFLEIKEKYNNIRLISGFDPLNIKGPDLKKIKIDFFKISILLIFTTC